VTLNLLTTPQLHTDFTPRITVIGVGGGGSNAVNTMIAQNLQGVEFVVANTDAQSLMNSRADRRIQLGPYLTQGLGAGAKPEIGRAAAEEATDEVYRHLDGTHMVFITAGMGGGTGTGAAPVIARLAKERNILTVGVVTKPFNFEGARRIRAAEDGIRELQEYVDTLIIIPNQNLFRLANDRTSFREAFKMADNVLYMGVRGVTDLMVVPGLINLDFADVRTVMAEMGKAVMGTAEADGDGRAMRAAEGAINNPLLEDMSMNGAKGLIINITGGEDLSLFEVDEAVNRINQEVDDNVNLIFGATIDETMNGRLRVSVVATGIGNEAIKTQGSQIYEVKSAPEQMAQHAAEPPPRMAARATAAPPPAAPAQRASAFGARAMHAPMQQPLQQPAPRAAAQPTVQARHLDQRQHDPRLTDPRAEMRADPRSEPRGEQRSAEAMSLQGFESSVIDDAPMPPRQIPKHLATPIPQQPPRQDPRAQPRATGPRPTLFAAPGPAPEPLPPSPKKSIFSVVTGALAGRSPEPAPEPLPVVEPVYAEPPRDNRSQRNIERQVGGEELGAPIPSFLRRQS
jgi:cell division protein FtsZ